MAQDTARGAARRVLAAYIAVCSGSGILFSGRTMCDLDDVSLVHAWAVRRLKQEVLYAERCGTG